MENLDQIELNPGEPLAIAFKPKVVRKCQTNIKTFLGNVNEKEKKGIDEALSNLSFGCNLDCDIAESDYFKTFVKLLRPGYEPPTSAEISTVFLETEFSKFENRKKNYENAPGILSINTVNHQDTKSVLSIISDLIGRMTFLKCFPMSYTGNYDDHSSRSAARTIDYARSRYCLDVYAIITKESSLLHIVLNVWLLQCNVEIANTLAESLRNDSVSQKAQIVLNEYKTNETLREILKLDVLENGEKTPQVWIAEYDACSCFITNLQKLKQLLVEGRITLGQEITTLLFSGFIESEIKDHLQTYDLLATLIKKFEKIDFCIGDAIEEWMILYTSTLNINFHVAIHSHMQEIMQPVALTANFLHPEYQGRRLNKLQLNAVNDF